MNDPDASGPEQIDRLLQIMAQLRDPQTGCPWDVKQDFSSIAPYTIEEAHEVADAIARNDMEDLVDELGDLLLQVVFHAQMAAEAGLFDFDDVARAISDKMVRRHPHVFGEMTADGEAAVRANWDTIKAAEKAEKLKRRNGYSAAPSHQGRLDDIPRGLPALSYAQKISKRAAKAGFDWPDRAGVWAKLQEEIGELEQELNDTPEDTTRIAEEIGDCLFALVNLARHSGVDADRALHGTNVKFARRFAEMERLVADQGRALEKLDLADQEALWQQAKATD
ncbi:MAG: nucleoside triphosphate pyrophosphohydrolase [Pseudomonadota bacterium]